MDQQQFELLLKAITASNERIAEMFSKSRNTKDESETAGTVTFLPNFESFNSNIETFLQYKQRFENFLQIKNVFDDKELCAKMLLNCIGSIHYNLICSLIAPKLPSELKYDEIVSVLEKHLCPPPNVIIEQHRFLCRFQNETENIADYVAALRKFTSTCDFTCECKKSVAELFLRAQFIRGLKDASIREKLLIIPDLTFETAVDKSLAIEASKIDNREISKNCSSNVKTEVVNKISKFRSKSNERNFRKQNFSEKRNRSNSRSRNGSMLNFHELGIHNVCLRCGRGNHLSSKCRSDPSKLYCKACQRSGHVQKVCLSTLLKNRKNSEIKTIQNRKDDYVTNVDSIDIFSNKTNIIDIYSEISNTSTDADKFWVVVEIEKRPQKFEVDSGAGFSLLPKRDFDLLNLKNKLQSTNVKFRSYTHGIFEPLGFVQVSVKYKTVESTEMLFIVPNMFTPVLGRTWIRHLNINLSEIDKNAKFENLEINSINVIEDIVKNFPTVFEQKIGKIPNLMCSLKLRENSKPVFLKSRDVPFALRDKVDEELRLLEQDGIITKVDCSDWGSPLVIIPKPDGNLRLCVDYKVAVNPQLQSAHHPIPKVEDILNSLRNSKYFCTLDLFKAYLHVVVDDDSKVIQTISTHRGTFRVNRLSFGIKTAPSEFHKILEQILMGLQGVTTYFDDIIVHAKTLSECRDRLIACLERLQQYNLHVNNSKCQFFKEKISYLGYVIQHNKISKCPKKIDAIVHAPRPKNADDVKRFLGMITYYSRFIPGASSMTYPLRYLLKKNVKFHWSANCEAAFIKLKDKISSDRVLMPFDPTLPVTVACDASPTGIAGVLSHIVEGIEKPVAFTSRSLTVAEQNYSQLDREALAIKFAVQKFHTYIYGREFTLITDNKPLYRIFHHDAKIPAMTSSRLLRYAAFLSEYNYKVKHRRSEENTNVDYLSRAPLKLKDPNILQEDDIILCQTINQISTELVNFETIAKETDKDPQLSILKQELLTGGKYDTEYTLQDGIIFRRHRVYIPEKLRPEILKELHHTHLGIVKMKNLARRYCYWKNIDRDIEKMVRECRSCAEIKHNPEKISNHHWEEPSSNFERVHIDYAGPFLGYNFLILMDAKSKWPEFRIQRNPPTSESTINLLKDIFSVHGLPQILVSDNASIFTSIEFTNFCKENGIIHKTIAPGHPATNGLAQRNVQTLKQKLKSMANEDTSVQEKTREILFRYRATPLQSGKTPAELYLGRQIRIKLDLLHPPPIKKKMSYTSPSIPAHRNLSVGDRVQSRSYANNKLSWKFGTVKKRLGKLHYVIQIDEGYSIKRHINQLRKCEVKPAKVTFSQRNEVIPTPPESPEHQTFNEMPTEIRIERKHQSPVTNPSRNQHSIPEIRRSGRMRQPPRYLTDYIT